MSRLVFFALFFVFSYSSKAATTYSCDGCTVSQYEALAKQTTGEVFVYDLVNAKLKRYDIVLVTPAKDSPTGQDIKSIVRLTPLKADVDYINKAAQVRSKANTISGKTIVYHTDVSVANLAAFKNYSVYDIALTSAIQRQLGNELLYGGITNSTIQDAVDVINDTGSSIISVILQHDIVVVFKVELGDGGEAVFIMSKNDIDQVPDFDITNSSDADGNDVITGNNSGAVGNYIISNTQNLGEFLSYLGSLGIPITNGGSTGTWGCTPSESGVVCKFIN